jgi:hypothetical protein
MGESRKPFFDELPSEISVEELSANAALLSGERETEFHPHRIADILHLNT